MGFLNRCLSVVANPMTNGRMTAISSQFTRPIRIISTEFTLCRSAWPRRRRRRRFLGRIAHLGARRRRGDADGDKTAGDPLVLGGGLRGAGGGAGRSGARTGALQRGSGAVRG